jgi:hypothetical protein
MARRYALKPRLWALLVPVAAAIVAFFPQAGFAQTTNYYFNSGPIPLISFESPNCAPTATITGYITTAPSTSPPGLEIGGYDLSSGGVEYTSSNSNIGYPFFINGGTPFIGKRPPRRLTRKGVMRQRPCRAGRTLVFPSVTTISRP